ncbi:hypothetical protein Pelo_6102 [Pelomyxa schiedti]|nr:hypothetical protein Pelo_6102 [Pelomyxa schiedti]
MSLKDVLGLLFRRTNKTREVAWEAELPIPLWIYIPNTERHYGAVEMSPHRLRLPHQSREPGQKETINTVWKSKDKLTLGSGSCPYTECVELAANCHLRKDPSGEKFYLVNETKHNYPPYRLRLVYLVEGKLQLSDIILITSH